MSDDDTLYEVAIQTAVSPSELEDFVVLLENADYEVVTDLEYGELQIRDREGGESA